MFIPKIKKIHILLGIVIIIFIAFSRVIIQKNNIEKSINMEILNHINLKDFSRNKDIDEGSKILNVAPEKTIYEDTDIYTAKVIKIHNRKLVKKIIENVPYYDYSFNIEIDLINSDGTKHHTDIKTNVFLEKNKSSFEIKELDNLEEAISKEITSIENKSNIPIDTKNNEDYLLYYNEKVDIQINYPERYIQTTSIPTDENMDEDSIIFYTDSDDKFNFVNISISKESEQSNKDKIDSLIDQGYTIINEKFKTDSNIEFTILNQEFNRDGENYKENIYVLNKTYKGINQLTIKSKINSKDTLKEELEIKSLIESIK